jgi:hypothetical protein
MGVVRIATVLCTPTVLKEVRICLAWSCFDESSRPCKVRLQRCKNAKTRVRDRTRPPAHRSGKHGDSI